MIVIFTLSFLTVDRICVYEDHLATITDQLDRNMKEIRELTRVNIKLLKRLNYGK